MRAPNFHSFSSWPYAQRLVLYSLFMNVVLIIFPNFTHAYVAPLYCSYDKSSHQIRCDVNLEGLVISDVSLNDGQCIVLPRSVDEAVPKAGDLLAGGSSKQPEIRDHKGTYEEGDSFYISVDSNCDLRTYTIKANDKVWRFDYKPVFPFYDPF